MIDALMYLEAARTPGVPPRLRCYRCVLREGRRAGPRRTRYFAALRVWTRRLGRVCFLAFLNPADQD
jgi:hypothetical protein